MLLDADECGRKSADATISDAAAANNAIQRTPIHQSVSILEKHFRKYTYPLHAALTSSESCSCDEEDLTNNKTSHLLLVSSDCSDEVNINADDEDGDGDIRSTRPDFYLHKLRISAKRSSPSKKKKKGKVNMKRTMIFILPPYNQFASLEPERLFTPRLVKLENCLVQLQSLNAFFSTLGGGYFLCRYLATAVRLARWQRAVALSMGDRDLAARCTVNEAYNCIHAGRIRQALALIKQVKEAAIGRGDDLTVSMCKSARIFARRVRQMHAYEGTKQSVYDELQRIRIVKDESKINRTFRPLKELSL